MSAIDNGICLVDQKPEEKNVYLLAKVYAAIGGIFWDREEYGNCAKCLSMSSILFQSICSYYAETYRDEWIGILERYIKTLKTIDKSSLPPFIREIDKPNYIIKEGNIEEHEAECELAHQYQISGNMAQAIKYFKAALPNYIEKIDTTYYSGSTVRELGTVGWMNLATADCYLELDSLDQAEDFYRQALFYYQMSQKLGTIQPNHYWTYLQYSALNLRRNEYDKFAEHTIDAITLLTPEFKKNPEENGNVMSVMLANLSCALEWYGDTNLAQKAMSVALGLNNQAVPYSDEKKRLTPNESTHRWMLDAYWLIADITADKSGISDIVNLLTQGLSLMPEKQKKAICAWSIDALSNNWTDPANPAGYIEPRECSVPVVDSLFYIYNIKARRFLCGSNTYKTETSVSDNGSLFRLAAVQSQIDPTMLGWTLSATSHKRPLFYESDGYAYINMSTQNFSNKDCHVWNIISNGDSTYRIQIAKTCKIRNRNDDKPTLGYKEKEYLGWVQIGWNRSQRKQTNTIVLPSVSPNATEQHGEIGINWKFLTEQQYKDFKEEIERVKTQNRNIGTDEQIVYEREMTLYHIIDAILENSVDPKATKAEITNKLKKINK